MAKRKILYEKVYPEPDKMLSMYFARVKETGKALYYTEPEMDSLSEEDADDRVGIFCLKCWEYHEYPANGFWTHHEKTPLCSCGKTFRQRTVEGVNAGSSQRNDPSYNLSRSEPYRLFISERDGKVFVDATCKTWHLNVKAQKPFSKRFTIRIIMNTATGQSYYKAPMKNGKAVFVGGDFIKNATFSYAPELCTANKFFATDSEELAELKKVLGKNTRACEHAESLIEAIDMLYMGDLYDRLPLLAKKAHRLCSEDMLPYRKLRRRNHKDSGTFPRYLYWGCSKVATKSVRKVLYKYPEQKWTLRLLYKELGIENIDLIRSVLEDRESVFRDAALDFGYDSKAYTTLMRFIRDTGMSDKEKLAFIQEGDRTVVRDAARLLEDIDIDLASVSADIRRCSSVFELHDLLLEVDTRTRNKAMWERYSKSLTYPKAINAVEGPLGAANFEIIRRPWDLKALGDRFHNCVRSYMEDVVCRRSIIVEMRLKGSPAACIELDGSGKLCRQAYAACNRHLEGPAEEAFNAWAEKHHIRMGTDGEPHRAYWAEPIPPFVFDGGYADAPF